MSSYDELKSGEEYSLSLQSASEQDVGERVNLVGLDIGTTTTSAAFATAQLQQTVAGRIELEQLTPLAETATIFTRFADHRIDERFLLAWLDERFAAAGIAPASVFGGGALITGLAAERGNAAALGGLIQSRLSDAVIATADDPRLEAWLAFMGSAAGLSRELGNTPVVNLDIGGGTTSVAIGLGGEVRSTGSVFIGARHVQVTPGTYRIEQLSQYARQIFHALDIAKDVGTELELPEVDAIVGFWTESLECFAVGHACQPNAALTRELVQSELAIDPELPAPIVTFSGGVGSLVYRLADSANDIREITPFGDLGLDFARRIRRSQVLAKNVRSHIPRVTGLATVFGLLRHATQLSGSSIYLPDPEQLPLRDLPILGRVAPNIPDAELARLVDLAGGTLAGVCFILDTRGTQHAALKSLSTRLSAVLAAQNFPAAKPLVLVGSENVGKSLGGYITGWGAQRWNVIVLDEIVPRDAQFVRVGRICEHVVPVSFYGMN